MEEGLEVGDSVGNPEGARDGLNEIDGVSLGVPVGT